MRKRDGCNSAVAAWWNDVAENDVWLSTLVVGEIRKGVELARRNDVRKADLLERWLAEVMSSFGNRVLPVDAAVAEEWGRMNAIRPLSVVDSLLAATAKVYDLTFVTRNLSDVAGLNVDVLNPFDP